MRLRQESHRRSTRKQSLRQKSNFFEMLEGRTLLTVSTPFAQFDGTLSPGAATEQIAISIAPSDFQLPARSVLLGFDVRPAAGSNLDPAAVRIQTSDGTTLTPAYVKTEIAGQHESVMLVNVTYGTYILTVGALNGSRGGFEVEVFLVGDANGDHQVGTDDGGLIRTHLGITSANASFVPGADANLDAQITSLDYALWSRNQGNSTSISPLTLSDQLTAVSATLGDGSLLTNVSQNTITGFTEPGATVALDSHATGLFTDGSTTADGSGHFVLPVTLVNGSQTLALCSTDQFGQHASGSLMVTLDTTPPAPPEFQVMADMSVVEATTTFRSVTLVGSTDPGSPVRRACRDRP